MTPMQREFKTDLKRKGCTSTKSHEKAVQGQDVGALITCRYSHVALRMSWERDERFDIRYLIYSPLVESI